MSPGRCILTTFNFALLVDHDKGCDSLQLLTGAVLMAMMILGPFSFQQCLYSELMLVETHISSSSIYHAICSTFLPFQPAYEFFFFNKVS